ncbi:hypothetical protein FDI24_gp067 [Acidovorax phage ACP17]|uniref:Uncharacterized protein n=1 Tax=Acidovorax phage ACP17 TaxID=2010329 RepID=A0A223AIY9_9CAUD|nr:hypothetical protein FDI24_gp067 [Acidovorax phage ACP17]ASS33932.1 hypothetical protein [Acidovorax phage ACP17]
MKAKSVIYWIYCWVNATWGRSVEIKRSWLRKHYSVNRNDIELHVPKSIGGRAFCARMRAELLSKGWTPKKEWGDTYWIVRGKWLLLLTIRETPEGASISIYEHDAERC